MSQHEFDADVIVVGGGPAGVTLANLLGEYGVSTIVLERELDIIDYPRAVGMDDEALRAFQTVGLAKDLLKNMIQNTLVRYHHSNGKLFAEIGPKARPFGWPRRNLFIQPIAERTIRDGLQRYPNVRMLAGHEMLHFAQDKRGVSLIARANGQDVRLRARYLVGADGGRSAVRKQLGIALEGSTHAWRWLVVDLRNDDRFEPFSGIYCDPTRPFISIDLPFGHRRFEFRLHPEDTDEEFSRPEAIEKLLQDKMPAGKRPDIIRSRIYTHHSRTAERFQDKRVFLVGDAAHLQPPFFGQGLNSGIRDVMNLSWKLSMVVQGRAAAKILDTYEIERRDHARKMVAFATGMGKIYAPYSYATERIRMLFFWMIGNFPAARDYILQMKFKPLPYYADGIVVQSPRHGRDKVGRMFSQPRVRTVDGCEVLLDDAIGSGFSILGMNVDPAGYLDAGAREYFRSIGGTLVQINRSQRGVGSYECDAKTLVLDDLEGAFRDMKLARPEEEFIVLRPDRYVFAVVNGAELGAVLSDLREQLSA